MLFYTGTIAPETPQQNPSLSLGGFKSSSLIANGELNNLFPIVTRETASEDVKPIRMIVFTNQNLSTINNLKIYTTDSVYSTIKIIALLPAYDDVCKQFFFEKVASETHIPYQGYLQTYTINSPLTIPSLASGAMIGLWIQKSLKLDQFSDIEKGIDIESMSCEELVELLEEPLLNRQDSVNIHFDWD